MGEPIDRATTIGSLILESARILGAAGIPSARLQAEVLLSRRLKIERSGLMLRSGEAAISDVVAAFRLDVGRRASGYPLQYITGLQEFYSLEFHVDARVLIPRPETEMIVDEVLRLSREGGFCGHGSPASAPDGMPAGLSGTAPREARRDGPGSGPVIADVGTGSGCIAVALASNLPACTVLAIDISAGALELARENARHHGVEGKIRFLMGDRLDPVRKHTDGAIGSYPEGVDCIVSNPPYIPLSELGTLAPELAHEPRLALCPGPDGLEFTAGLIEDAPRALRRGGWLLIELAAGRSEEACGLLDPSVWGRIVVQPDMQGIPRLLVAQRRDA